MLRIDSASNDRIKLAVKIASSAKHRKKEGLFFLEGLRLCRDAALTGVEIEAAFFTEKAIERNNQDVLLICEKAGAYFEISDSVEAKLAQTETSQGFFCLCRMKKQNSEINPSGKYIALENIQDPSNLGAIARTAEALGIDGAILCGCCDRFSPKSQRAAMGSLLRLSITECDNLCEVLEQLRKKGMKLYATTPESKAEKITECDMSGGVVAVIGNEGNGVTEKVFSLCEKVTIPMLGRAESLNASMAAAITMWEMMR
ncbi:MAG: RNA methyltransferase [Clostridia bacterium]|nr:RNA methyltransferase [Clostridia bacterium]